MTCPSRNGPGRGARAVASCPGLAPSRARYRPVMSAPRARGGASGPVAPRLHGARKGCRVWHGHGLPRWAHTRARNLIIQDLTPFHLRGKWGQVLNYRFLAVGKWGQVLNYRFLAVAGAGPRAPSAPLRRAPRAPRPSRPGLEPARFGLEPAPRRCHEPPPAHGPGPRERAGRHGARASRVACRPASWPARDNKKIRAQNRRSRRSM
jgi:hypothetical protein